MTAPRHPAQWGNGRAGAAPRLPRRPPRPHCAALLRHASTFAVILGLGFGAAGARAAAPEPGRYERVDVAPAKTSIYIGSVTMTMPGFTRAAGIYSSTYEAKVFPFFFSSEHGRLSVDIADAQLAQLARGEAIEFKGEAVNADGAARRIEGRATPADAASGRLKVRVFVSRRIELIFNTTYRFPDAK